MSTRCPWSDVKREELQKMTLLTAQFLGWQYSWLVVFITSQALPHCVCCISSSHPFIQLKLRYMANPFRLVFGGPSDDVAAHHSSGRDILTVSPAATVFANPAATVFAMPEGNMETYETLVLTADQLTLAEKAADAIKNGKVKIIEVPRSSGDIHDEMLGATYYEAPAQTRELYESLKQSAVCRPTAVPGQNN